MNSKVIFSIMTAIVIIVTGCLSNKSNDNEQINVELSFWISIFWESNESYNILLPSPIVSDPYPTQRSLREGQPVGLLNESEFVEGNGTFIIQPYNNSFVINITSNTTVVIKYEEDRLEKLFQQYISFSELSNKFNETHHLIYFNSSSERNVTISYYAYQFNGDWGYKYSLDNATLKKGWNPIQFSKELYEYGD